MKALILRYRNNNYYNCDDTYVFLDASTNKVFSSKVHFYNSNWYTNKLLNFKCSSIKSCKL